MAVCHLPNGFILVPLDSATKLMLPSAYIWAHQCQIKASWYSGGENAGPSKALGSSEARAQSNWRV